MPERRGKSTAEIGEIWGQGKREKEYQNVWDDPKHDKNGFGRLMRARWDVRRASEQAVLLPWARLFLII